MRNYLSYFTICLFVCLSQVVSAKRIVLDQLDSGRLNIITAESGNYRAGDTLVIPQGIIAGLRFVDFHGTSSQPIVIINEGGQVQIKEYQFDGVKFDNCSYIHITGTGHAGTEYGFFVLEAGYHTAGNGVSVANFSTNIEIDNIEIRKVGFVGIMAKTDPKCDNPNTWRRNGFVLRNLNIHHNYIHDTHGEGLYIGFTGGYLIETKTICSGQKVFGHWLDNVSIHHNTLVNIGWDGIQFNLGRNNCTIYNNTIRNYGISRKQFHNFGMSIGAGIYKIYNNSIYQSGSNMITSSGMQLISTDSGTQVFNNEINNAAGFGIFIHSRHKYRGTGVGIAVINNTIIKTGEAGILYNSEIGISNNSSEIGKQQLTVPFDCKNNLIASPGATYENGNTWKKESENYIDFNSVDIRDAMQKYIQGNVINRSAYQLNLTDPNTRNYDIASTQSPLYNKGVDVSSYGINFDNKGRPRPTNSIYDVGANEYQEQGQVYTKGYLVNVNGVPVNNVVITGLPSNTRTNTYGIFTQAVKKNSSYIIRPVQSGYYFTPENVAVQAHSNDPDPVYFVIHKSSGNSGTEGSIVSSGNLGTSTVTVYPNPSTTGKVTVVLPSNGEYDIHVYDDRGNLKSINEQLSIVCTLDLGPTGGYVLQILKDGLRFKTIQVIVSQ